MKIIPHYKTTGDIVNLKISRNKHIRDFKEKYSTTDKVTDNFSNLLTKSLNEVNNLELKATDLTNELAVNPDNVNIHDVLIASEQAEMAVLLTKGIIDRVIRSYREITSMR
jgi:flagellar hook-basal body complex protein FliE